MAGILQRPPVPAAQRSFARHEVPNDHTVKRALTNVRCAGSSDRMGQRGQKAGV